LPTARQASLVRPMKKLAPEEAFLEQVLALAQLRGWRRAHFRPAQTGRGWRTAVQGDSKGFPDVLLVRPRTKSVLVAELKIPPNTVTPEQGQWLADCEACGIAAFTWTPADWDEIERVLEHGPEIWQRSKSCSDEATSTS
jgi:hypothetical protein